MKKFVWAMMCSAAVTSPAFAQDEGMAADSITCAEFLAMDADGRAKAVETVQMASAEGEMASDDMMESDQMASDDMASDGMMESDQMASDDMTSDGMMESDQMASDDMASDDMMESDQMASDDAMMGEDTVTAVQEVCERDPNVSLADAVKDASGH